MAPKGRNGTERKLNAYTKQDRQRGAGKVQIENRSETYTKPEKP